jgi:hypothetical protein
MTSVKAGYLLKALTGKSKLSFGDEGDLCPGIDEKRL